MANRQSTPISSQTSLGPEAKRQVISTFNKLLVDLWKYLVGVVGPAATIIIFQSALRESLPKYKFLKIATVHEDGIEISINDQEIDALMLNIMVLGFQSFLDSSISLITDLTGGILITTLNPLVSEFNQHMQAMKTSVEVRDYE